MTDKVPATETPDQPDRFAEVAAALHLLATRFTDLIGSGLPLSYLRLDLQPGSHDDGDLTVRAVDAFTSALLGHAGQVKAMHDGTYQYRSGAAAEFVGPIGVEIYGGVSTEWALEHDVTAAEAELAEREAEAEKARTRVAELRAARKPVVDPDPTGLAYSRADDADDPTPVGAREPLHTGAMTDGGLVDETAVPYGCDGTPCTKLHRHPETEAPPRAGVLEVGGGRVVHECCGKLDAEPHRNFCKKYVPSETDVAHEAAARRARAAVLQRHHFRLEAPAQRDAVEKARVEALDEDNRRATAVVVADLRAGEGARIVNPNLARFLAEREEKRREAAYYLGLTESAKHYPADTPAVPAEDATLTPLRESASEAR